MAERPFRTQALSLLRSDSRAMSGTARNLKVQQPRLTPDHGEIFTTDQGVCIDDQRKRNRQTPR